MGLLPFDLTYNQARVCGMPHKIIAKAVSGGFRGLYGEWSLFMGEGSGTN